MGNEASYSNLILYVKKDLLLLLYTKHLTSVRFSFLIYKVEIRLLHLKESSVHDVYEVLYSVGIGELTFAWREEKAIDITSSVVMESTV
jgi:hypothetical protein